MLQFTKKEKYDFADLVNIMDILRSEDGCPWDREQDHASIRKNLIEETYEVCDCIDRADLPGMCEELGDLMLQVVFHSKIASDLGEFELLDVTDGVCKKLILRHPHIFGDVRADTSEEVLKNWDQIKRVEKNQKTYTETLEQIPSCLPGLMRAEKVQRKAAKANFDFKSADEAAAKIGEELSELKAAEGSDRAAEEFGDLLFSVVNVGRLMGLDSEEAITSATNKFIRRFSALEGHLLAEGRNIADIPMQELDTIWEKIKIKEHHHEQD